MGNEWMRDLGITADEAAQNLALASVPPYPASDGTNPPPDESEAWSDACRPGVPHPRSESKAPYPGTRTPRHPLAPAEVCGAANPWDPDWYCRQRPEHRCEHNWYTPHDGCTSWDDHCPVCAEHTCEHR